MVDFDKIFRLRQEINRLIDERPELSELQEEIDRRLSAIPATDYQRRNQVIQEMMLNSWYRIIKTWEGK